MSKLAKPQLEGRSPQDEQAERFETLYTRYNKSIYAFFANRCHSKEEARDLTQDTFLVAFRNLNRFQGTSTEKTWLIAIALNIWRDFIRYRDRQKRKAHVAPLSRSPEDDAAAAPELIADEGPDSLPLERLLAKEHEKQLLKSFEELPVQMRHVITLRLIHDMKYEEIAQVMKVSINTVRSQIFEARRKLRKQLADDYVHFPQVLEHKGEKNERKA